MDKNKITHSLSEVHSTVETKVPGGFLKKLFAFAGPAYLVSVGYMDPGNWATDLAGGSKYGYALIWVLLMSNLMALLLQSLSARLGIVRGRDLAQASRESYDKFTNGFLYILAEIAIASCDLAEVLGMAIGLQLLFDIPLLYGVVLCVLDTFILLFLLNYGVRKMEAFIIALVAVIGGAFFIEMFYAKPSIRGILSGFVPSIPTEDALYIAIGIIGATVMPHNLYLHSALVQSRKMDRNDNDIRNALKFNFFDTTIALNLAFFVNAAILILAATVFFKNGLYQVAEIQDAHKLLAPMLGTKWAAILFAVALIASGQSSTITGTLAGQIIMEGYLNLRIAPWIRRIITRSLAVIPAFIVIQTMGEAATGKLLIFSQVILSMQLGFAVVPLIHFVSDKHKMGAFTIKPWVKILAWISAAIIIILNIRLVWSQLANWYNMPDANLTLVYIAVAFAFFAFIMLVIITLKPVLVKAIDLKIKLPHQADGDFVNLKIQNYNRIAVAVDFSTADNKALRHALMLGGSNAEYLIMHTVESAGAFMHGKETADFETDEDNKVLDNYVTNLKNLGYSATKAIGYGNPKKELARLTISFNADLLVLGSHGHKGFKDIFFGTTIEAVRHSVKIPVLVVK
jgi:manganese transport protein